MHSRDPCAVPRHSAAALCSLCTAGAAGGTCLHQHRPHQARHAANFTSDHCCIARPDRRPARCCPCFATGAPMAFQYFFDHLEADPTRTVFITSSKLSGQQLHDQRSNEHEHAAHQPPKATPARRCTTSEATRQHLRTSLLRHRLLRNRQQSRGSL